MISDECDGALIDYPLVYSEGIYVLKQLKNICPKINSPRLLITIKEKSNLSEYNETIKIVRLIIDIIIDFIKIVHVRQFQREF